MILHRWRRFCDGVAVVVLMQWLCNDGAGVVMMLVQFCFWHSNADVREYCVKVEMVILNVVCVDALMVA